MPPVCSLMYVSMCYAKLKCIIQDGNILLLLLLTVKRLITPEESLTDCTSGVEHLCEHLTYRFIPHTSLIARELNILCDTFFWT